MFNILDKSVLLTLVFCLVRLGFGGISGLTRAIKLSNLANSAF